MHLQILGSGSDGNAALVRAGETNVLLDAGLPLRVLEERLEAARVPAWRVGHVALTHGHLDHARASGALAQRTGARIHCCEALMRNASIRRAPRLARLTVGRPQEIPVRGGAREGEALELLPVEIPHDALPTVAFRLAHRGRVAVLVTDMGRVSRPAARALAGAHLLVLEFNHDLGLLREGPYPEPLKRRIAGPHGHLSNEEACEMLRLLAGPELHTLVLAHLSRTNNTPALAEEAARATLGSLGLGHVRVVAADPERIGESLEV